MKHGKKKAKTAGKKERYTRMSKQLRYFSVPVHAVFTRGLVFVFIFHA